MRSSENIPHPTSMRSSHEKHDQPVISKTMFRDSYRRGVADGHDWPRAPGLEGAVTSKGGQRAGPLRRMGWDAPSASHQRSDGSLGSDRARGDHPSRRHASRQELRVEFSGAERESPGLPEDNR